MTLATLEDDFVILSGTAHRELAAAIAERLDLPLGDVAITRFPDGETSVRLNASVRGRDVFLVQPTCPPVNEHLMELLLLTDACRRAAARRIVAVVPYFGYARADKRTGSREPITASLVARLMQSAGMAHVITLDLHAPQIEGFYYIPVDNLSAVSLLCEAMRAQLPANAIVVSPDAGRVHTATEYAQRLGTSVVVLHKRRVSGTQTEVTHVVGDVHGRACLIIDDMISTGGTLARGVDALLAAGARPQILVAATHGLFVEGARQRLQNPSIQAIYTTNSMPQPTRDWPLLHVVPVAWLLAEAIRRLAARESLQDLT